MPDRGDIGEQGASPFALLIRRSPGCEKLVCTTCGGVLAFMRAVERFVGDGPPALVLIAGFGPDDARLLLNAPALPLLMRQLPRDGIGEVVRAWLPKAAADPRFATMAVFALDRVSAVAPDDLVRFLDAATPYLLENASARDRVAMTSTFVLCEVPALYAVVQADRERARRAREAARAADEDRRRAELARRAEREAALLAAQVAMQEAVDDRNARRLSAMEKHRTRLAGLPVAQQLADLLQDLSIPIEHYPLELAPQITADVISILDPGARRALAAEVARTPLRRWRRLGSLVGTVTHE